MRIDARQLRALGESLVTDRLVVFPVRHHSPACAWQLRQLFAAMRPSTVLVEGPRAFTPLVPLLVDPAAQAPLAVYACAAQDPEGGDDSARARRAAYYPFCDYSPELVALREAAARGIPSRFIDLDFDEQCMFDDDGDDEGCSLLDERHYRRSAQLDALARQLGCRDHEELWEHLFEVDGPGLALVEHVARVAAWCELARLDTTPDALAADGTLAREAEMAHHVREALARRPGDAGPVLVVVGGFHAVAIAALQGSPRPRPAIGAGAWTTEVVAPIRYSFERLDRLNGYAAGMTSPAWHQALWEQMSRRAKAGRAASPDVRREAAMALLQEVAAELRERHGLALPTPAVAAAYGQALQLAALRGRTAPARSDVLDAVTSCFVKGEADTEGAIVLAVARKQLSGTRMGTVPRGAPVPPLVGDVGQRLRRARLKIDEPRSRRLVLELYRRPEHRASSRLLHGLALLAVPFATRLSGPDFARGTGLERVQETWEYQYTVATEAALVEASTHGPTLPLAVADRFSRRLDRMEADGLLQGADAATMLLAQACLLGLHDHVPRITGLLRTTIAKDPAFPSVVAAATSLGLLWESREPLDARALDDLPALLHAAWARALFLGHGLRGQECPPRELATALASLRELLGSSAGQGLDAALYWQMLEALQRHDSAEVRGAAMGLRFSSGCLDATDLADAVEGHFNGTIPNADAVGFLDGLLLTAREAAWQQPRLLAAVDRLLAGWTEADFLAQLPGLRLAFATMTPRETDRIADAVAALHGGAGLGRLVMRELDAATMQEHLDASQAVAGLLAADGLGHWVAP